MPRTYKQTVLWHTRVVSRLFLTDRFEVKPKKFGLVSTLCVGLRLKRVNTVQPSPLPSQDPG